LVPWAFANLLPDELCLLSLVVPQHLAVGSLQSTTRSISIDGFRVPLSSFTQHVALSYPTILSIFSFVEYLLCPSTDKRLEINIKIKYFVGIRASTTRAVKRFCPSKYFYRNFTKHQESSSELFSS
jgi:hypothetical protein